MITIENIISYGDMATSILTGSSAMLGLSGVIIITLRLSKYATIVERLTESQYDRLHDFSLISIIFGFLSIVATLVFFLTSRSNIALILAGVFMAIQAGTLALPIVINLRFKFYRKCKMAKWLNRVNKP